MIQVAFFSCYSPIASASGELLPPHGVHGTRQSLPSAVSQALTPDCVCMNPCSVASFPDLVPRPRGLGTRLESSVAHYSDALTALRDSVCGEEHLHEIEVKGRMLHYARHPHCHMIIMLKLLMC